MKPFARQEFTQKGNKDYTETAKTWPQLKQTCNKNLEGLLHLDEKKNNYRIFMRGKVL